MKSPAPFESVFDATFDVAIYGTGFIGFAAALRLAHDGGKVLLFDSACDLLWEATRALENRVGEGSCAWEGWHGVLEEKGGADDRFLEPALAEVIAAGMLRASSSIRTLLYAVPVGVREEQGRITGVCVATKGGFKTVRATRWVDASEEGVLTRLSRDGVPRREPQGCFHSLVVQTLDAERLENSVLKWGTAYPGLEILPSFRPEEFRLRWPAGDGLHHRKIVSLVKSLRASGIDFIVTHSSLRAYPVYTEDVEILPLALPENLWVASPSVNGGPVVSLADRFDLGRACVEEILSHSGDLVLNRLPVAPSAPVTDLTSDVIVAGAGTAGAVSAISAARRGARTIAIDFASAPGGVGVGGLITAYFHGAPGGLQSEVDLRTQEISFLMTGKQPGPARWHHNAKRTVLLEMFEETAVQFIGGALLCGVERDASGRVLAVMAATPGRLLRLSAAAFVDATGDGDLYVRAGGEFVAGRSGDGRTLSYTQSALLLIRSEEGFSVRGNNFDAGWVDATDSEDLTRARLEGLAHYQPLDWRQVGPFIAMAPLLGIRQSRQIVTDYSVTLADMVSHARFDDSVGNVATVADSHAVDFEFESDDLAFYFWTCRAFRHRIHCELPYRMLLPVGLSNVWIACRAAGISVDAANGLRMQREMQRLGEAAGIAAALAARCGKDSRTIDLGQLMAALNRSGAREALVIESSQPSSESLLVLLDGGLPGIHLWHLYQGWDEHREPVLLRLNAVNPNVSFYAAAVASMAGDSAGEARLLEALCRREVGVAPDEVRVPGAYGQLIDVPFWLQAVVLLRRIGGEHSLVPLRELVAEPNHPFNVLTTIGLTLEALVNRLGAHPILLEAFNHLLNVEPHDAMLPPSRSLWRALSSDTPQRLANDRGTDIRQDHIWQLHLILLRIQRRLGHPLHRKFDALRADPRGFVRNAVDR